MPKLLLAVILILLAMICCPAASAHRLNVFCWNSGDNFSCEASFSGGKKAVNCEAVVTDKTSHAVLFRANTGQKGHFKLPLNFSASNGTAPALLVTVSAGAGHVGSWTIMPEDYPAGLKSPQPYPKMPKLKSPISSTKTSNLSPADLQAIAQIVTREIGRQLGPLNKKLARNTQNYPGISEIAGGVGYIIGLFGLFFYLKARKRK